MAYSTLLGLIEPVTGTESGTWGDSVNKGLTEYLDISIAGTNTITTDGDVTLTQTQGTSAGSNISATTAQYMQLLCTGARTAARNITVPATSKVYVVNNSTTGGFAVTVKTGASSGVSITNGEKAVIAYSSAASDFVKVASSLISGLSGTLPVANGGTGANTLSGLVYGNGTSAMTAATAAQIVAAIGSTPVANATNVGNISGGTTNQLVYQTATSTTGFAPPPSTAGYVLGWTGSAFAWVSAPAASSASNLAGGGAYTVVYQSAAGTTAYLTNGSTGQVLTANTGAAPTWTTPTAAVTSFQTSLSGLTPSTSTTGAITLAGTLGTASGGTNVTAAGANGNVLTSNGSNWYSAPAPTTSNGKLYFFGQF